MKQISIYFKDDNLDLYEYIENLAKNNRLSLNTAIMHIIMEQKKLKTPSGKNEVAGLLLNFC